MKDAQLLFSDSQTVTAAAKSTNIIDQGAALRDIGTGKQLFLVVHVDETMDDAGDDSSLGVSLEGDSSSTITPDATELMMTIPALSEAGSVFIRALSPGLAPLQLQYLQLSYDPNNGNLSAGKFSAYITDNVDRFSAKPNAYTIAQ